MYEGPNIHSIFTSMFIMASGNDARLWNVYEAASESLVCSFWRSSLNPSLHAISLWF